MIVILTAVSLGISAFLCGCSKKDAVTNEPDNIKHIIEEPQESVMESAAPFPEKKEKEFENPVEFVEKILEVNGRQNRVFLLMVDLKSPGVKVKPYLAFDRIFGFDYLQGMAEATGAAAAVNGGFFFEYGLPSGLFVSDGELISAGTGNFYSLILENDRARFEIVKTVISLKINERIIEFDSFNRPPEDSGFAVFSDYYGSTDRLGYLRTIMIVTNGVVVEYRTAETPVEIPKGGYVIVMPADYSVGSDPIGQEAQIEFEPSFDEGAMAYECSSMLIENGISLAGDVMPWVGNLNHYDPRTCVGIMKDGRLGFAVIDGRQENYSSGTTGRETADLLISLGFTDAVMLDGGGSSQMIYNGITVNSPSSGPNGRPIAGGFMVIVD